MSTELTVDEAIAAIERCAFTIPSDYEGAGRRVVHCFIGTMGADWDAEAAIDAVRQANIVGWYDSLFGRCLAIQMPDGKVRRFDTVTP